MLFTFALPTFAVDVDLSNGEWKIVTYFQGFNDNYNTYQSLTTFTGYSNQKISLECSNNSSVNSTGKYRQIFHFSNSSGSALVKKDNDFRIEINKNYLNAFVDNDPNKEPLKYNISKSNVVVEVKSSNGSSKTVNATVTLKRTNYNTNEYSLVVDIPYQDFDIYTVSLYISYDLSAFTGTGSIHAFSYIMGDLVVSSDKGDKTTGLLDSIIEWIKQIVEDIKSLGQSIVNLPELIKEKLSSLFENIANKLTELGNNIIEGLKSLFIPQEGFFDDKKAEMETFLEDHFGIIYTAPNIVITIFEKLLSISPGEPALTMPAIEFEFLGEHIKLSDPITINLYDFVAKGTPLYTIYQFYRAGMTAFLIFLFVEYAMNKYNYLFGKDGEAVN